MSVQTIVFIVIGLGCAILLATWFIIDDAFEKLIDWLFIKLGWSSGHGPLVVIAEENGEELTLTMHNQGNARLKLAAVEGRNRNQQRQFPRPYFADEDHNGIPTEEKAYKRFSAIVLEPHESATVKLKLADLLALDCSLLAILDANGRSWRVERFKADELK